MKKIFPVTLYLLLLLFFICHEAKGETIDLQTAIQKTLQNSWGLKSSMLNVNIADDRIQTTKDAYKPTLTSDLHHSYNETGATLISPVPATETYQDEWLNSISKMFESGFSGSLSADLRKTDTTAPGTGELDDSRKNLVLGLSYPLMKNRGGRTLRYPVEIAGFGKTISQLSYEFLMEGEILFTVVAFYEVCLLLEEKKAVRANFEGAKSVVETMKRRHDIGTSEAKDLYRSQAAVSAQKTRLIIVENSLSKRKIDLLKTMGEEDLAQSYDVTYDLTTSLQQVENKTEILLSAYPQRKDLQQLEYQAKIAEKNIALKEDERVANLDLGASYATDGFSGNNTFSESETPGWMLGVTYRRKFGGEAKISEAIKEKEKIENTIEDKKLDIANDVLTAIEDVNALIEALAEAENLVGIQTKRLSEEEKDFDLGRTSVRDIEEARDDLTFSQLVLAQARINVIRAYANLLFVSGKLDQTFYAKMK